MCIRDSLEAVATEADRAEEPIGLRHAVQHRQVVGCHVIDLSLIHI